MPHVQNRNKIKCGRNRKCCLQCHGYW